MVKILFLINQGIKSMDWIYSNESKDGYVLSFTLTSDDGKKYKQNFIKNKQVKRLHQLNNLNYYNFIQKFMTIPYKNGFM